MTTQVASTGACTLLGTINQNPNTSTSVPSQPHTDKSPLWYLTQGIRGQAAADGNKEFSIGWSDIFLSFVNLLLLTRKNLK